jgi:hypothetical protein
VIDSGEFRRSAATRNKWPSVLFQRYPASLMVGVVPISRGEERAGVDQKHSVAPEAVSK